jgi:hypothetical protein
MKLRVDTVGTEFNTIESLPTEGAESKVVSRI